MVSRKHTYITLSKLLSTATKRLSLYLTLPSRIRDKILIFFSGFLNISLTIPSLVNKDIYRVYDFLCRVASSRVYIEFENFMVRSCDCEGMLVFHPNYEYTLTITLLRLLKRGSIFVDIGAHLGRYTILASKIVGPQGLVIALEPIPETYKVLKDNVKKNNLNNIIVLPLAAWNVNTTLEFTVPPGRSGSTAKSLKHVSGIQLRGRKVRVKATTLDMLILEKLNLKRVDVIKIDVEGARLKFWKDLK